MENDFYLELKHLSLGYSSFKVWVKKPIEVYDIFEFSNQSSHMGRFWLSIKFLFQGKGWINVATIHHLLNNKPEELLFYKVYLKGKEILLQSSQEQCSNKKIERFIAFIASHNQRIEDLWQTYLLEKSQVQPHLVKQLPLISRVSDFSFLPKTEKILNNHLNPIQKLFDRLQHPNFDHTAYMEEIKEEFLAPSLEPIYKCEIPIQEEMNPLHALAAPQILLPRTESVIECKAMRFNWMSEHPDWIVKRVNIQVNNTKIDVFLTGKKEHLTNGKWVLYSGGYGLLAEEAMSELDYPQHFPFHALDTNFLFFNYPGVGHSEGPSTREQTKIAYQAILRFLEDEVNGVGAQKIIGYGTSLGGGIQGIALENYPLKESISYVFVKNQTFSKMSKAICGNSNFYRSYQGWINAMYKDTTVYSIEQLIQDIGWELNVKKSSKTLKVPEIIIQKATKLYPIDDKEILDDTVISAEGSLAKALLKTKTPLNQKTFIGVTQNHTSFFTWEEKKAISEAILNSLSP